MSHSAASSAARQLPPGRSRRALSIEWKLPLLITGVLAAGLAAFLAFAYVALARRSESVVRDRFQHASRLVAQSIDGSLAELATSARGVATNTAIVSAVADPGTTTARDATDGANLEADRALAALLGRDSLAVQLIDLDGRVIASVGKAWPSTTRGIDIVRASMTSGTAIDQSRVSALVPANNRMLFWVVTPVVASGRRAAYILQPRYTASPGGALAMLRELTREDLALYTYNTDGSGWNVAPGRPIPPARRDSSESGLWYDGPGSGRLIAEEARVTSAPWVVVIGAPVESLLAKLRTTVEQLAVASLLLLAIGAALAWAIGRRITRPLVALTSAAEQVASGTYDRPIPVSSDDEVGRLATSFHEMAQQVSDARRELEQRAADAHRVANELSAANSRLQTAMAEAEAARVEAEHARVESESANRAKGDFLAMMSHELRTPLNAIGGYVELIELGIHGPVTDAQRDALRRIARSQAHLLTLINDVLNFARIDAGQMQYAVHEVPMNETLAGLEALVAPQVAARRLTFMVAACDPELTAAADRDKVRQVVLNLLSNAIKYTPEGGTVYLDCDADATTVRVRVRDTGPGIEAERLPLIFEPFVQGHRALNRPNEGVGLGLTISRDLARGMGGDVVVASEIGAGSVFTLTLPRLMMPTHALAASDASTATLVRADAMIVE